MRGDDRTLLLSASGLRATNDGTADFSWQMKGGKEEGGTECEGMSWPGFFLSPPLTKKLEQFASESLCHRSFIIKPPR